MAENARERILEAACDLIASDGIDDVRIARVATRARASTALVHHYFSTREELLAEALDALVRDRRAGALRRGSGGPRTPPTTWRWRSTPACPFPGAQERDWALWVELWLRAVRDREHAPARRRALPALSRVVRRRRSRPGSRAVSSTTEHDPGELADLAVAVIDGAGVRALVRDPALGVDRARALVAGLLERELGLDAGALASDPVSESDSLS